MNRTLHESDQLERQVQLIGFRQTLHRIRVRMLRGETVLGIKGWNSDVKVEIATLLKAMRPEKPHRLTAEEKLLEKIDQLGVSQYFTPESYAQLMKDQSLLLEKKARIGDRQK